MLLSLTPAGPIRHLDKFEQALLREVLVPCGWQDLIEYAAERVSGYPLRDLRPAWERLVAEGIIRDRSDGFMVTDWTTEEIEARAKVLAAQ